MIPALAVSETHFFLMPHGKDDDGVRAQTLMNRNADFPSFSPSPSEAGPGAAQRQMPPHNAPRPQQAPRGNATRTDLVAADVPIAAAKPAGLLTVPGRGPDKAHCLWQLLAESHPGLRVVHRLDMAKPKIFLMGSEDELAKFAGHRP